MRSCFRSLILAALVLPATSAEQARLEQPRPAGAEAGPTPAVVTNGMSGTKDQALRLSDDPPLLLEDAAGTNAPAGPGADNNRCQVCHLNMTLEVISVTHAKANLGCAKCHGPCDAHIADESWASGGNGTAPEIMYPRHKINALCRDCHNGEKVRLNRPGPPCPKLSGKWTYQKFCTDCHGNHRLPARKCKWK